MCDVNPQQEAMFNAALGAGMMAAGQFMMVMSQEQLKMHAQGCQPRTVQRKKKQTHAEFWNELDGGQSQNNVLKQLVRGMLEM